MTTDVRSPDAVTGEDDVFTLAKGYYTARALVALWRLGLFDRAHRDGELVPDAIAAEWEVDEEAVRPLLNYLVVRGLLELTGTGSFRLTPRAHEAWAYRGYLSTMIGAYEPVFARLEDLVTGRAVYGRDVSRSHEEMVRGLTVLEDRMMGTVGDAVLGAKARKVLDLGCGSARMITRMCELDPDLRAVGVDRDPGSCAVAEETVAARGLADRVAVVQGDAFDLASLPADVLDGVDSVTVMFLLHEVLRQRGRAGTVGLLRQIADLVGPDGRLIMVEVSGTVDVRHRERQLFVPEYELLHEYTNQRLAARSEWERMVGEAGMEVADVLPVDMCQSFCLVARRPGELR
ncbi:SAM-dependent methyltransferase [Saccharothrix syringae]|uniref:Methyltransferase domain-containing protein n=1 Tax=Saccharothrix syringae TaxID=103733 RepID=A0A5Q0H1P6_SACSY|nr:class I SAM-dependent methyltransferase [Saccharothrix syringae]QFZ20171.1 methyltransferase domain-containing protein [Saccharothrix syringae]